MEIGKLCENHFDCDVFVDDGMVLKPPILRKQIALSAISYPYRFQLALLIITVHRCFRLVSRLFDTIGAWMTCENDVSISAVYKILMESPTSLYEQKTILFIVGSHQKVFIGIL